MDELRNIGAFLERAARAIRLVDRVTPLNVLEERQKLERAWAAGQRVMPNYVYASAPDLSDLRMALGPVASLLDRSGGRAVFYAARARELMLEARLAEAVGSSGFRVLAAERFAREAQEPAVRGLVAEWLDEAMDRGQRPEPLHRSCDRLDPESLVSRLDRALGERRLAFRVVVAPELSALAATGEGVVVVAQGKGHSAEVADRVVTHELFGHVLPRAAARSSAEALFRVGFAGASEDEEGRALLFEERLGHLRAQRKRELALRHRASLLAHAGASFVDVMDVLLAERAPVDEALRIAERALRGGGLGRESAYLPAYVRVRDAFAKEPKLERWFERGRVSLEGARWFALQVLERRRLRAATTTAP